MKTERAQERTNERTPAPHHRRPTDGYWEDELMQFAWSPEPRQNELPQQVRERETSDARQLATTDF